MKNSTLIFWAIIVIAFAIIDKGLLDRFLPRSNHTQQVVESPLTTAIAQQRNGAQVQGDGVVIRLLSDDNEGSRHQRFIIQLATGQTLLIAHNIDLAARVAPLAHGDRIEFNGVYESNPQGGVIHWTHHDPSGRHIAGWIRRNGQTYQ